MGGRRVLSPVCRNCHLAPLWGSLGPSDSPGVLVTVALSAAAQGSSPARAHGSQDQPRRYRCFLPLPSWGPHPLDGTTMGYFPTMKNVENKWDVRKYYGMAGGRIRVIRTDRGNPSLTRDWNSNVCVHPHSTCAVCSGEVVYLGPALDRSDALDLTKWLLDQSSSQP